MADQNGSPPSAAASVTMPTAPWMTAPTASTAPVAASSDTVVATPVAAPPTAPVTNPVASPAATPVAAPASAVTAPAPSAPVIAAPPPAAAPAAPTTAPARAIARPPVRPISRMAPRPSYDSLIKKPASVTPEKKTVGPFSIFLYGLPGIGKTRFAAASNNPIFITPPNTFGDLDPKPMSLNPSGWTNELQETGIEMRDGVIPLRGGVLPLIRYLTVENHPHKTLVIDELNAIEAMCEAHVIKRAGTDSINSGELSYGNGYLQVATEWRAFTAALDDLRKAKKMDIVLLAHSDKKNFKNPEGPDYDRYQFRLSEKGSNVLFAWSEIVLFANYKTIVSLASKKATRGKGISDGRFMYTQQQAAYDAKNRHSLPERMALSWSELWTALHPSVEVVAAKCVVLRNQILVSAAKIGDEALAKVENWMPKVGDNVQKLEMLLNNLTVKLADMAEDEDEVPTAEQQGDTET